MSHELFYTSAPKGLQPGSRGFCTVACTKGMPTPLIERVEALSGYRPLFPPHDAKAALNPINYAHVQITVAGKTYHVLSRVCSAGLDYTDRTNKFAHHVVLEAHELPPGGPAWLLRQPGFMETKWDGQVRYLPTGRVPPHGDAPPTACREWKRLVGDAGWAGVAAESFLKNPDRPVYLIFEPGIDLLPLIVEAAALVPTAQRWRVTFNAYLSGLPAGLACAWRGVAKNSEDAATAQRVPGALVINLAGKMGAPPPSAAVEAARAGKAIAAEALAIPVASAVPGGPPPLPVPAGGRPTDAAKPAGAAARAPTLPPPPLPGMRPEPGLSGDGGQSRAGFRIGMVTGIVTSLIPLAALVATGMVLIPSAGFGPREGTTPVVVATEMEPQSPSTAAEAGRFAQLSARNKVLDKELRDANAELQRKEDEAKAASKDAQDAKDKLDAYKKQHPHKKTATPQGNPPPDKGSTVSVKDEIAWRNELQKKENEIKDWKDKYEKKKTATVSLPPGIISQQFDLESKNMNDPAWRMPGNVKEMLIVPLPNEAAQDKGGFVIKSNNGKTFGLKQHFDKEKSRLSLLVNGRPGFKTSDQDYCIAEFSVKGGCLAFSWWPKPEDKGQEFGEIRELKNRIGEILPTLLLRVRTFTDGGKGNGSYLVSLHPTKTISLADFKALSVDEFKGFVKPTPHLAEPNEKVPVRWFAHLWRVDRENRAKEDKKPKPKLKTGDEKALLFFPTPGAAIFMRVKVDEKEHLVELYRWK